MLACSCRSDPSGSISVSSSMSRAGTFLLFASLDLIAFIAECEVSFGASSSASTSPSMVCTSRHTLEYYSPCKFVLCDLSVVLCTGGDELKTWKACKPLHGHCAARREAGTLQKPSTAAWIEGTVDTPVLGI